MNSGSLMFEGSNVRGSVICGDGTYVTRMNKNVDFFAVSLFHVTHLGFKNPRLLKCKHRCTHLASKIVRELDACIGVLESGLDGKIPCLDEMSRSTNGTLLCRNTEMFHNGADGIWLVPHFKIILRGGATAKLTVNDINGVLKSFNRNDAYQRQMLGTWKEMRDILSEEVE